ncbi:hypothetical protein CWN49_25590 [Klebsiella michiganensis]|uniref:Uncharacterized protein n=1 Tax=Klebsiella michiganensis TaxID=1134687 RepID=A0A2J5PEB6_9ENTR|nr:hypothetical protein CWN49_25590 [Klebsiella michiganensis]
MRPAFTVFGQSQTYTLNALSCCILVSSEVSHHIARMVNPLSVHTYTGLHIPATRSGIGISRNPAGPLRHNAAMHVPYTV